jgi:indolepyruvate ferredoxin oxidoreductase beta subunit
VEKVKAKIDHVVTLKGNDLAAEAGNSLSLNMVMLGGLIGTGSIPINAEAMKETIATHTKKAFLESNLKAFDLGMAAGKSQAEAMGLI